MAGLVVVVGVAGGWAGGNRGVVEWKEGEEVSLIFDFACVND